MLVLSDSPRGIPIIPWYSTLDEGEDLVKMNRIASGMGQKIDCLVRLERLRKSYDGLSYAVDDLSLSIFRGEFLTLLGPSGSGKTTTLMMLAGFERPTSGDIMLEGRSIQDLPPHKRDFGMVFQNYALFPH